MFIIILKKKQKYNKMINKNKIKQIFYNKLNNENQ